MTVNKILKESGAFTAWAARRRYNVIVLPLTVFSRYPKRKLDELIKNAAQHGIAIEAGGRDLSSLVPRRYFFLHKDFFRLEDGRRKKACHFCPTNPGTIALIGKEGGIFFKAALDAAGIKVFHLWPDKDAETAWCSCPSCRAFSASEQNRIAVNTAADVLASLNPAALITFFERPGEGGDIPLRKNLVKLETLSEEREFPAASEINAL